jgi:choline-glycine betaine transporter
MINYMLSPALATLTSIVILLLTYLVTSADSAVLIINTIAAAYDESPRGRLHLITWGLILTLVICGLLLASGLGATNTAMIIQALPFSLVMALMAISLVRSLARDGMRAKRNSAEPAE